MMSATLPLAMLEMFKSAPDICTEQATVNGNRWPFPGLMEKPKWESPKGHFKGWAPGSNNNYVKQYRETVPKWLPEVMPTGFSKWLPKNTTHNKNNHSCLGVEVDGTFYNPISDPLKITNLNDDILDALQTVFRNETVKIRHVALVMLESYREELFPLQQGSDYHQIIMKSHGDADEDEINARLSQLCPVAERITGKSGNFKKNDGSDFDSVLTPEWNDTTQDGFGGINIVGGFTTASLSFKSMAAIHCGAWPMPVDSFEESETESYQPCIPQVLDLFNNIKENKSTDDFVEQQWLPAFFQSITDGYDRQDKFDKKIGFKHIITKDRLDHDAKEGDGLEEINYFGYAETTLKSHIKDYIKQVQEQGKRMFLSHFTSTTHHPWGVPKSFKATNYLNTEGDMGWHEDFNKYLNSMRFTDAWLGELLQIFEDFGISNETLIVFVGDHGQAFKEDISSKTGTYENGHISNFRVPITFRHPNIPRVQYNANATSLSILPTILDLLIHTRSLNEKDIQAASDLIYDYEGQSLIRPYKASHNGRRAWNFGVINGGGSLLSLTSADAPWRLVLPLDQKSEYRFTDLKNDPLELKPLGKWSMQDLANAVKSKYGEDASQWAVEAEAVARWWGLERKRLWGYNRRGSGDKKNED
jgi:arylsulfatase A-like enzyme